MKSQTQRFDEATVQVGKLIDEFGVADLLGIMVGRLTDMGVTRQADILSGAIDRLLWREKHSEDENAEEYYRRNARQKETK